MSEPLEAGAGRLPRRVRERVAHLRRLRERVERLAEGVAENRPLERDLVRRVTDLEQRTRRAAPGAPDGTS